jgi:hypothetical protein
MNMPEEQAMQTDAFFQISREVRYVALYLDGQLTLHERPGLANASDSIRLAGRLRVSVCRTTI